METKQKYYSTYICDVEMLSIHCTDYDYLSRQEHICEFKKAYVVRLVHDDSDDKIAYYHLVCEASSFAEAVTLLEAYYQDALRRKEQHEIMTRQQRRLLD